MAGPGLLHYGGLIDDWNASISRMRNGPVSDYAGASRESVQAPGEFGVFILAI